MLSFRGFPKQYEESNAVAGLCSSKMRECQFFVLFPISLARYEKNQLTFS